MTRFFEPEFEKKLRRLGWKKWTLTLVNTLLWVLLVIGLWLLWVEKTGRSFTDPSACGFAVLCLVPFFPPFRAHNILLSRTFYGKVAYSGYNYKRKSLAGTVTRKEVADSEYLTAEVHFQGDNGAMRYERYRDKFGYEGLAMADSQMYYKRGDRVLVVRGLKYPMKVPMSETEKFLCPKCGNFVHPDTPLCDHCKADFS